MKPKNDHHVKFHVSGFRIMKKIVILVRLLILHSFENSSTEIKRIPLWSRDCRHNYPLRNLKFGSVVPVIFQIAGFKIMKEILILEHLSLLHPFENSSADIERSSLLRLDCHHYHYYPERNLKIGSAVANNEDFRPFSTHLIFFFFNFSETLLNKHMHP